MFNHLADFLKGRKARIKLAQVRGDWKDSTIGSSAGTVLGPILFVAYVKDIPSSIKPKFADDVSAIAIGDTDKEVEDQCQRNIDLLQEWCEKNGMKLNELKTKVINFSEGTKGNINVFINNHKLEISKVIKYLGVLVDDNLDFNAQVSVCIR